jgi:thiamine biosynthesis lipoprotein
MALPFPALDSATHDQGRAGRGLDALVALGFARAPSDPPDTTCDRVAAATVRMTCRRPAMGTRVMITALDASSDRLSEAIGCAFTEMDRLTAVLSRHDPDTPLSHLNRTGRLDDPPPELAEAARQARWFHRLTGGAFDVTVAPLVSLYESRAAAGGPWPTDAEVREVRALVGARRVTVRRRLLAFGRQGMALTLDGIAKGRIVDAVAAVIEQHGVRHFLVEAGGDIRAHGTKEDGRPWTVAVHDPARPATFADALHLTEGAVATSGSYVRRYDENETHHHIVDPQTGVSPGQCRSVTVTAPTAMAADALATSVFLMGPADGVRFIDRLAGCACLVLDRNGRSYRSRAWRGALPVPGKETT